MQSSLGPVVSSSRGALPGSGLGSVTHRSRAPRFARRANLSSTTLLLMLILTSLHTNPARGFGSSLDKCFIRVFSLPSGGFLLVFFFLRFPSPSYCKNKLSKSPDSCHRDRLIWHPGVRDKDRYPIERWLFFCSKLGCWMNRVGPCEPDKSCDYFVFLLSTGRFADPVVLLNLVEAQGDSLLRRAAPCSCLWMCAVLFNHSRLPSLTLKSLIVQVTCVHTAAGGGSSWFQPL